MSFTCSFCGRKRCTAEEGSERAKLGLCAHCYDWRCSVCGKKGFVKVDRVAYCKEHEIIPAMRMLAPMMRPDETVRDTVGRLAQERIAELRALRGEARDK